MGHNVLFYMQLFSSFFRIKITSFMKYFSYCMACLRHTYSPYYIQNKF